MLLDEVPMTRSSCANFCGAPPAADGVGEARALRKIVVSLRKTVGADETDDDATTEGGGVEVSKLSEAEAEAETTGVGSTVTNTVLTNVNVDREEDRLCEDGSGVGEAELLCSGAVDTIELGNGLANEDEIRDDDKAAVGLVALPRKGVGITVELGLGGGIPPGYESSKMSSCAPSLKLY